MVSSFDRSTLSEQDKAKIEALTTQYNVAKVSGDTAGMTAASSGANSIRAGYGYSGGSNGNTVSLSADQSNTKKVLQGATSQTDYLNELYAAQQKAKIAALNSAYNQNVADLNNTAAQIPATYNTARNSAAASSAIGQAAFNERAAASGLNNGAGGQASLSMSNTLSGNLSSLDNAQASKLADLDTQRAKMTAEYNNAIQQAAFDSDSTKAQALYNEAVRVDNNLVSTSHEQANLDYQRQQAQTAQNEYLNEKKLNDAKVLMAYGNFAELQKYLGLSDAETAYLKKVWAADNPKAAAALGI